MAALRRSFDVVVVGGGAMGLSTAYWLTRCNVGRAKPLVRVCVVERDQTYAHASTMLSAGGIRQQFSNEENILLSQASLRMMQGRVPEDFEVDPADLMLRDRFGYLLLAADDAKLQILRENVALQQSLGARTREVGPTEMKETFPWMNTEGLLAGSYGGDGDEGWFDPALYHRTLREKCRAQQVEFMFETAAAAVQMEGSKALAVRAAARDGSTTDLYAGQFVNAAGCGAARVGRMFGWENLPVEPRKRYTFSVQAEGWKLGREGCFKEGCTDAPCRPFPLLVDTNGVWIRPEGNGFICGVSPAAAVDKAAAEFDFDVRDDATELFEEIVWPTLAERVPQLEALRVAATWAGHYEYNTVDQNAILGFHPSCANAVYLNGFSGHGIQQSLAAGRAAAELLEDGRFRTLDLTRMRPTRFEDNALLIERNVV